MKIKKSRRGRLQTEEKRIKTKKESKEQVKMVA